MPWFCPDVYFCVADIIVVVFVVEVAVSSFPSVFCQSSLFFCFYFSGSFYCLRRMLNLFNFSCFDKWLFDVSVSQMVPLTKNPSRSRFQLTRAKYCHRFTPLRTLLNFSIIFLRVQNNSNIYIYIKNPILCCVFFIVIFNFCLFALHSVCNVICNMFFAVECCLLLLLLFEFSISLRVSKYLFNFFFLFIFNEYFNYYSTNGKR